MGMPLCLFAFGEAGLGLAVCKAIAEAHGGGIALDDRDEGASFRVTLPRAT